MWSFAMLMSHRDYKKLCKLFFHLQSSTQIDKAVCGSDARFVFFGN